MPHPLDNPAVVESRLQSILGNHVILRSGDIFAGLGQAAWRIRWIAGRMTSLVVVCSAMGEAL